MNNNNIQNPNPAAPINQNPLTNSDDVLTGIQQLKQEEKKVNNILTELGQTGFDQLIEKYTLSHLYNLILEPGSFSYLSIIDQFVIRRQLLVTHFIKPEAMPKISEKIKDKIIALLAALKTDENQENIAAWLSQINQDLILPKNFKVADYHPRAYELWCTSENLKKIIIEATYNEYMGDILMLMFLPEDKYQNLSAKVKNLTAEVADSYTSPKSEQPTPQILIDNTIALFTDFGRTPIYIQDMKEENIFGNMVEVVSKIEFAVSVSDAIRSKKLPRPLSNETIINEAKSFMMQDIVLR